MQRITRYINSINIQFWHNLLSQRLMLLIIAVLLLSLSFPLYEKLSRPLPLKEVAEHLQVTLKDWENDFYKVLQQHELIESIAQSKHLPKDLNYLKDKHYAIFIYRNDSLIFWNTNEVLPEKEKIQQKEAFVTFKKLQNGYYQLIKKPYVTADGQATPIYLVAAQLIKLEYDIQNVYMTNGINPKLGVSQAIAVSQQDIPDLADYYPITCDFDKSNLKIYYDKGKIDKMVIWPVVILQLISWLFLLVIASTIASDIARKGHAWLAFFFLAAIFIITRLVAVIFDFPISLYNLWLFDRFAFHTWSFFLSPGDLLITLIMWLWLAIFAHKNLPIEYEMKDWPLARKYAAYIICTLIAFGIYAFIVIMLRSLTLDFKINFTLEIDNLVNLKGFMGLLSLCFSFLILFLVLLRAVVFIWSLQLPKGHIRVLALLPIVIIYFAVVMPAYPDVLSWYFMLPFLAFLAYMHWAHIVVLHAYRYFTLKRLAFWVFTYTAICALLLYGFSIEREEYTRKELAKNIAKQRDSSTEYNFEDVAKKITMQDEVVQAFYRNPLIDEAELAERVKNTIMGAHFNHYHINIYTFDADGQALRPENEAIKLTDYEIKITHRFKTDNDYLFVAVNPATGNYMYLSKLPIFDAESPMPVGYMIIEMVPKSNRQSNVYPELTIEDKFRQPEYANAYSYAIYNNGKLETAAGDYNYNYFRESIFSTKDSLGHFVQHNKYSHFVFAERESQIVVVSNPSLTILSLLSLSSYLFIFAVVLIILFLGIAAIVQKHDIYLGLRDLLFATLRKRINFAIIFILLLSFTVIAVITGTYLYNRSTENYKKRLEQKQQEILMAFEDALQTTRPEQVINSNLSRDDLFPIVSKLSEIHGIDINLFNIDGILRSCSQPAIFEKKLIADIIDPNAYYQIKRLHKLRYMQNERIAGLSYLASYLPIKNDAGNIVGILNIPYFSKEKELRHEISSFLITLINVYVLLLITSSMLAIYLANSITNPLVMIGEKLKNVRLGQKNEQLMWNDDDEIGALVEQYNKTIAELEKSAERLASTERQQAWQEMARQVAHEIKNPLTPMKLSIQHLQRAYKDNRPNLKEMTERVTQTVIEQIDTLSQIASEFSNFAKMPKPQNEVLDIRDIVDNVVNFVENTSTTRLHKIMPDEPCLIYADKNQLLRVFNNLIKNALQAIPDERQGIIVVNVKQANNWVIAAVVDNGIGIDEEKKEKVFTPNFTTKSSGMGLGLAMSRNIIEGAYGKIWFESKIEEGTTFFVKLPLYKPVNTEEEKTLINS